jgi:hypothetical protein
MASAFTFEQPLPDNIVIGDRVSLSLDKDGNPGIVCSVRATGELLVARRAPSGVWSADTVTGALINGAARPRLAIDSTGNPQVAYQDKGSDAGLMHAVRSAAGWSITRILPTRLTPGPDNVSAGNIEFLLHPGRLDTESRDVGYFVYVDGASRGIGFAHTGNIGPTPVTVELDPNERTDFAGPSAAFDSSENFFVAYTGITSTGAPADTIDVKSSHVVDIEQGTFSVPSVIEETPQINVRSDTSIVRTEFGGCVAYFDMANKTVKASVFSGGAFGIETVATGVVVNDAPSAAKQRGQFRVAYADTGAIKLASRASSGAWTSEVVEAVGGRSPSLAFDNAGTANIAYVNGTKLRFARRPA